MAKILLFQEYADLIQHFSEDSEVSDENFDKKLEGYVTKRVLDLHRKDEYWFIPKCSKQDRREKNPQKVMRLDMAKIIHYHTNRCGLSEQIIKKIGYPKLVVESREFAPWKIVTSHNEPFSKVRKT